MKPFYERDNITIYNGDCLEVMAQLRPVFDAIISDPPYETTDLRFDKEADGVGLKMAKLGISIVKDNGYLVSFAPIEMLAEFAKVWKMRYSGVWVKEKGGMRTHTAKKPMSQSEVYSAFAHPKHKISGLTFNKIYIAGEPYTRVHHNTGYIRGGKDQMSRANNSGWTKEGFVSENSGVRELTEVLFCPAKGGLPHSERTAHPTQKPEKIMRWLIERHTNPGDLVLDPFLGSGSTAKACLDLGRRFVGIELNRKWCEVAIGRLNQPSIFQVVKPEPPEQSTQLQLGLQGEDVTI